ncbi:Tachykinin-like peptides receptor 99D [Bulinus truncatus]|nr:Tachykinin-like peptides receptor 99D [Bulinus truncatus]
MWQILESRYIAIIHPLRPRLTGRIVLTIITVIWVLSFLLALPNLLYATTYTFHEEGGRTVCYLRWPDYTEENKLSNQDMGYNILLMVLNYFLPMLTLFGTYARIGWELWGGKTIGEAVPMQAERVRSKRKVVKMMVAVVVIFGVCWLPTHIYFILTSVYQKVVEWAYIQQVYLFIYWLAMSNSMYNPIVYCLMNARTPLQRGYNLKQYVALALWASSGLSPALTAAQFVFRQGFLRFFRWCPCHTCRQNQHLLVSSRGFYSTRMSLGSERDKNGSLIHTTVDSLDDHISTPSASMYRMHPMSAKTRGNNCYTQSRDF